MVHHDYARILADTVFYGLFVPFGSEGGLKIDVLKLELPGVIKGKFVVRVD
jgi:hypothetical protein